MSDLSAFEKMLASGQDGPLLRFTLGEGYLKHGEAATAVEHLAKAVELDPQYSAAWRAYGKALVETGDTDAAREAYARGIEVAETQGDKQAAKEMRVFLKRLDR